MKKLKDKYAPKGLLHFGQGKWYPGEPLPRWSLSCFWRKDGEPVWDDAALFADESDGPRRDAGAGGAVPAQRSRRSSALDPKHVFPAYEDTWYYLWRERKLPANVDPFDARLDDPLERARLRKMFHQGLDKVAGHVLPLSKENDALADRAPGSCARSAAT